jgi:signal peptidase II
MLPFSIVPYSITLTIIALFDAALKMLALRSLPRETDPTLSPVIAFALHKNPGITFDLPIPLSIVITVTCVIIIVLAFHLPRMLNAQPCVGLGFLAIILGAFNNMIDRIVNGFTIDYIMLFRTSVLNLSDLLILFGAIMIMVYYTNNPRTRQR